jgi:thioredoxin reductase
MLFATGVKDGLPEIEGLAERWGNSAFHCPYCHGYELNEGEIAVIAASPMSVHQAQLIPEWGKVTFFTNGALTLEAEARVDLVRRGVTIDETPVARLGGHADLVLTDGRRLPFAGLFVATRTTPASDIAERFGCDIEETPMGLQIRTTAAKETTIPGAFACGDVGPLTGLLIGERPPSGASRGTGGTAERAHPSAPVGFQSCQINGQRALHRSVRT